MVEDMYKWEQRKKEMLDSIKETIVSGDSDTNNDIYLIMRELLLSSKTRTSMTEFYKEEKK